MGDLGEVLGLHAEVDGRVAELEERYGGRLQCGRGCSGCCVDGITVFAVEAERIRRRHGDLLAKGEPHPPGACAFLDGEGSCRVYADRPYVCRTQGLPLRWFEEIGEEEGAEIVERRDICPLNLESLPPNALAEEDCWLIGPDGAAPGARSRSASRKGSPGAWLCGSCSIAPHMSRRVRLRPRYPVPRRWGMI